MRTTDFLRALALGACVAVSPVAEAGPLHDAAALGDLARIDRLLAEGVAVDDRDTTGTPLQWAAFLNQDVAARLLLARGADPNADGVSGTPLQLATQFGNAALVARLLRHGADPNRGSGSRPLAIAARKADARIVGQLLAAGADPRAATETGMTALHEAAQAGSLEIVRALVELGADPGALTPYGKPPIHYALLHGHTAVAAYLRSQGWAPRPVAPIADLLATADLRKGRAEFQACGRCCHNVAGENLIGPALWNTVEGRIAGRDGFAYSSSLAAHSGTWTLETLNRFLAGPAEFAPGTSMDFAGIAEPERRANLIAYISRMSDDPVALSEPE